MMDVADLMDRDCEPDFITAMDRDDRNATLIDMFVEKVVTVQDSWFLCRQKQCSMIIPSEDWVHNRPNGQYRCPACGKQYRPWKLEPNCWIANKVLIYPRAVCLPVDEAELAAGLSDGPTDNDQQIVFPVVWPHYIHDESINRFHSIISDIKAEMKSLPPQDRIGYAMERLPDPPGSCSMQHYEFLPQTQAFIDDWNYNDRDMHETKWQYDHTKRRGYWGIKLGPEVDLDKPLHQTEFLRAWGFALWLSNILPPVP
jgi:hypothetical protein